MSFHLNLKPLRQCPLKKIRYHSEAEAKMAIVSLQYSHKTWKSPEGLRTYRCDVCDAYHIGHPKDGQGGK